MLHLDLNSENHLSSLKNLKLYSKIELTYHVYLVSRLTIKLIKAPYYRCFYFICYFSDLDFLLDKYPPKPKAPANNTTTAPTATNRTLDLDPVFGSGC